MTCDELIDMATQNGFSVTHTSNLGVELYLCTPKDIERFATLVAAASKAKEREACAKVCRKFADESLVCGDEDAVMCFEQAEEAIRARGQA